LNLSKSREKKLKDTWSILRTKKDECRIYTKASREAEKEYVKEHDGSNIGFICTSSAYKLVQHARISCNEEYELICDLIMSIPKLKQDL
jgi:hypothetical protein